MPKVATSPRRRHRPIRYRDNLKVDRRIRGLKPLLALPLHLHPPSQIAVSSIMFTEIYQYGELGCRPSISVAIDSKLFYSVLRQRVLPKIDPMKFTDLWWE